jgi:hypothetical protein
MDDDEGVVMDEILFWKIKQLIFIPSKSHAFSVSKFISECSCCCFGEWPRRPLLREIARADHIAILQFTEFKFAGQRILADCPE